MRKSKVVVFLFLVAASLLADRASAQQSETPPPERLPSPATESLKIAREQPVANYAAVSFLGGVPAGFFALPAMLGTPIFIGLSASGVAVVLLTGSHAGRSEPGLAPEVAEDLVGRDAEFQTRFRHVYEEEVRRRRVRASRWGGLAGFGVGLGTLVWIVSRIEI
jgi:hypothetical protein